MPKSSTSLLRLAADVRACRLCSDQLEHGVRPVFQVDSRAAVLIAGQAPGSKVHRTGIPFDDPSGDRLREWMGIDRNTFYDASKVAILPMGFCYPGTGRSGDKPPMPICAPTWRARLLAQMPHLKLTLVIGQYAQKWHLNELEASLTLTVKAWASYDESIIPLPHPSPRNNIWLKRNPWFADDVLPTLKERVARAFD